MSTQNNDKMLEWLFLDLNFYFDSIEQELQPALLGKPIGVVPVMMQKLAHKAGMRLRKMGTWAGALSLKVRFGRELGWGNKIEMVACQDTLTLREALLEMWQNIPHNAGYPTSVSIT